MLTFCMTRSIWINSIQFNILLIKGLFLIGEREPANLVVYIRLARFLYICLYSDGGPHTVSVLFLRDSKFTRTYEILTTCTFNE